jgi:hypothetical protein
MAKRTSNRSQANDAASASPPQPKARRSRGTAAPPPDTIAASSDAERSENDDGTLNAASGDEQPAPAMSTESEQPASHWIESGQTSSSMDSERTRSSSMGSEPSAEDIRMRAYQRYLERGGGHGMDFEDWLEAERELKRSK